MHVIPAEKQRYWLVILKVDFVLEPIWLYVIVCMPFNVFMTEKTQELNEVEVKKFKLKLYEQFVCVLSQFIWGKEIYWLTLFVSYWF